MKRILVVQPSLAVEKIDRVLTDHALQASILADAAERSDRFSARRFMTEVRGLVDGF